MRLVPTYPTNFQVSEKEGAYLHTTALSLFSKRETTDIPAEGRREGRKVVTMTSELRAI